MTILADIDSDTGLFLGLAIPATALAVLLGLLALAAQVARRERLRSGLLRVFYAVLVVALVSVIGLLLSG